MSVEKSIETANEILARLKEQRRNSIEDAASDPARISELLDVQAKIDAVKRMIVDLKSERPTRPTQSLPMSGY